MDTSPQPDPSSPLAGWEQLVVELTEGFHARRVVHVLIDGAGALLSASDHVMTVVSEPAGSAGGVGSDLAAPAAERYYHESVGGRFDGEDRFDGTYWRMWTIDTGDDAVSTDDDENVEPTGSTEVPAPEKRVASAEQARELRGLAVDVLARAGVRRER